jgi:hypothetical protein
MSQIPPPPSLPEPPPEQIVSDDRLYVERRHSGCRAVLGCLGLIAVLLLVVVLVPSLLGAGVLDRFFSSLSNTFNPPTIARSASTETILTGIQPLGQLVSISAQLAKADIDIGVQQGGLNACGFSASHVAQGTIEAGIDLAQIDAADISYDAVSDTYTVTLPAPVLTSCRIDFIRQYARSTTVCNVDWDEARLLANYIALNDFREDAFEGGILDRAAAEARLVLSNFISALTGSRVTLVIEEGAGAVPASCAPETPQGWFYDESSGSWINR